MQNDDLPFSGFKSGYVAIAGPPNAGKSTLLNRILGTKIAITSKKPQTTRNRILGVLHRTNAQLVFIDTPGIFEAKDKLNLRIVESALSAVGEADLVLLVVDVSHPDAEAEFYLLKQIRSGNLPVILALNKIDLIEKSRLLGIIDRWSKEAVACREIVPISATRGLQIEDLLTTMENYLPFGPPYFPQDALTDLPERFLAAEMIREQVFRLTGEEIPYASAVTVDTFREEQEGRQVSIAATIHLERDSQKGIVIGKNGSKLKQIGTRSREQIEQMLQTKVYLKLFVRVQKNWRRDTRALKKFGY